MLVLPIIRRCKEIVKQTQILNWISMIVFWHVRDEVREESVLEYFLTIYAGMMGRFKLSESTVIP